MAKPNEHFLCHSAPLPGALGTAKHTALATLFPCFELLSISLPLWFPTWRRQWHPTPVFLPGKSHGQRSLVGCRPWGREESDTTERLHFHFSLSCTGKGNGNPLQCSCLENPRDGGAWWAAIYGVAQSRTWLKWLSNSSMVPNQGWICSPVNMWRHPWLLQSLLGVWDVLLASSG